MRGAVGRLTVDMLRTLGHPGPDDPDDWPLWVEEPTVASRLIEHWRNGPPSPFTAAPAKKSTAESNLPPGTRALHALYAACASIMAPYQVDRCTLAQIGAMASSDQDTKGGRHSRETRRNGNLVHSIDTRAPGTPERYRGMRPTALPAR
jgi:hypothetical protein